MFKMDIRSFFVRCLMDKRHTIGKTNKSREALVVRLLNDTLVEDTEITEVGLTPSVVRSLRNQMLEVIPFATSVDLKGEMNRHHDFDITCAQRGHVEMKITSKTPSSLEVLTWTPWVDTVQFLQGQLKSALGTRILGDCGEPMFRAWYDSVVSQEAPDVTYDAYKKIAHSISVQGNFDPAAKTFIQSLRTNKSLQESLQSKWLDFETSWLSTHELNHAELESVVREVIEDKDWWLCISPKSAQWIEGFQVKGLTFAGRKSKKFGGTTFLYTLSLQKKSGGDVKEVPMEFKFHWKNGGQAVQNLNYLLI